MSSFDFNDFKFDKDDSKKKSLNKKKIIGITTAIAAILVIVLIILLAKGCGTSSSSVSDKEKILNLAKNYMNKGAYDRALDYLDKLLENDPYDIELNTPSPVNIARPVT